MSLPTGPKYSKAGKELKERLTDDIVGMLNKIKSFLSELQSHSSTTAVKHQPVDLRALPENRKKLEEETKSYQRGTASSLGKSSSSGAKGGKAGGGGAPSNEKYEPPSSDVKADVDAEVYTSMEGCQAMLKEINGFKEYLPEEVVRSYRDSLANMERQWEREQDLGTKAIEEQLLGFLGDFYYSNEKSQYEVRQQNFSHFLLTIVLLFRNRSSLFTRNCNGRPQKSLNA